MSLENVVSLEKNISMSMHQLKTELSPDLIEKVIVQGDLKSLTPAQRIEYYKSTCESLGLNPITRPFEYVLLNGKLVFYARKDATEQLRNVKKISITQLETKKELDIYIVTAHAKSADGRTDVATGAVSIKNLQGDALANALMKAETKAKRRVTLSLAGLGFIDESEISSVQGAKIINVNSNTGEIEYDDKEAQDIINKLKNSQTIEELAKEFSVAKNSYLCSFDLFKNELIRVKNEKKIALEEEAKKLANDFFGESEGVE